MPDLVKVTAIKRGFYANALRDAGDVFEVEPAAFSAFWMKKATAPVAEVSIEAEMARREAASAAGPIDNLDDMPDEALAAHYAQVMGERPHHNLKRETLIERIAAKLNED